MVEPVTIAVQDSVGTLRKITKIIPYKDGGFAQLVPYHRANTGLLLKFPADYSKQKFEVAFADSEQYSAKDRVKLSFHPDGFIQFSGENPGKILSGRGPDGAPKGLGILARQMAKPVQTGPTFGATIWGLSEFAECKMSKDRTITFAQDELYYRACNPETTNAIILEGFLFPAPLWAGVRGKSDDLRIQMTWRNFEGTGAVFELRVIPLHNPDVFIGLFASYVRTEFPTPSGFIINSLSDPKKNCLMAIYPIDLKKHLAKRLDYVATSGIVQK
jgi:hypothetical protein